MSLTVSATVQWPKIYPSAVEKGFFLTVNRQKCRLILTVERFQGISKNVTFSADLHGLLASLLTT